MKAPKDPRELEPFKEAAAVVIPAEAWADAGERDRLARVVQRLAAAVFQAEKYAKHTVSRADLRADLEAFANQCDALANTAERLGRQGFAPDVAHMIGAPADLPWDRLRHAAKAARDRAKAIPSKGGRASAAEAEGQPGGLLVCAVAVSMLWKKPAEKRPNDRDPRLAAACEALWLAAAGEPAKGDVVDRWSRHLADAREAMSPKAMASPVAVTAL